MFIGQTLLSLVVAPAFAAEPVELHELSEEAILVMEVSDPSALVSEGFSLVASGDDGVESHKCTIDASSLTVDCGAIGTFPVAYRSDSTGNNVAIYLKMLGDKFYAFGAVSSYAKVVPGWWGWLFGYECEVEDSDITECEQEAVRQNPAAQFCDVSASADYVNGTCQVTCHVDCHGSAQPMDDTFVLDLYGN